MLSPLIADKAGEYVLKSDSPTSLVIIRNEKKQIIYARKWKIPVYSFRLNINMPGNYMIESDNNTHLIIIDVRPMFFYKLTPLPRPTERKYKPADKITQIIHIKGKTGSPASISCRSGVVKVNELFDEFPKYAQDFILLHEEGHLLYNSEHHCDLYALNKTLEKGGNLSPCIITLVKVLKKRPVNIVRLKEIIGVMNQIN